MHSTQLLLQLSLFVTFSEAFFPWFPHYRCKQDDTCEPEKRGLEGSHHLGEDVLAAVSGLRAPTLPISQRRSPAHGPQLVTREIERLANKYGRFRSARSETSGLGKRQRAYRIVEPAETTQENSAGIWQDGSDFSYFVQVEVGSQNREMFMLLDTGAGTSWVMGSDCDSTACQKHELFNSEDSDTFETAASGFSVSYGTGSVEGVKGSDTISIAGLDVPFQFGVANDTSDDFNHFPFDGLLGLSLGADTSESFMKTVQDKGALDKNIFCVFLNRAADGPNTGEISFGGCNSDKQDGEFGYTAVDSDEGAWAIPMDGLFYDGERAGDEGRTAYIDTGTTYVFGPQKDVEAFHKSIPGSSSSDGTTWKVPCDSDKEVKFSFSGKSYTVSSKDWRSSDSEDDSCTSNIYGHEVVKGGWLLGDLFLKNVYAVFDVDEKRIGFASRAETPSDDDKDDDKDDGPSGTSISPSASSSSSQPNGSSPTSEEKPSTPTSAEADGLDSTGSSLITMSAPSIPTGGPDDEASDGGEASPTSESATEEDDESSGSRVSTSGVLLAAVFILVVAAVH